MRFPSARAVSAVTHAAASSTKVPTVHANSAVADSHLPWSIREGL